MTTTTHPVLRPELRFDRSLPDLAKPRGKAFELATLLDAGREELVGFALGHGIGPLYGNGSVTEYLCAFVGNGDGKFCDGRAFQMHPEARRVIDRVIGNLKHKPHLAREIQQELQFPDGTFETVHFRDFVLAMHLDPDGRQMGVAAHPQILMARPSSPEEARQRVTDIAALFGFLGEWHTLLNRHEVDLSGIEALLADA